MKPGITILSRLFWPNRFGGLEHVLWELSNALCDHGVSITALAETDPAQAETRIGKHSPRDGIEIIRQPAIDFGRLWRVGELVQVRWWMKALRHAPPGDIIWANEPTGAIAAILSGRRDRLLYRPVFCYDGLHRAAQTHAAMHGLSRTKLSRRLDRWAYRGARWVVDESHNLAEQHTAHYGEHDGVHVIRNGTRPPRSITCTRSQFGLRPNDFVVGFVGRPGDPCKDLPFLLEAMSQMTNGDKTRLLIAGGGDGLDQAKEWVRRAGLDSRCMWAGQLEDVSSAYRAMDVLVLPSRFETFGNVIVEALAHGVPAIGRRRDADADAPIYTASEELIEHNQTGLTVDPHMPADLAADLDALHAQPDRRAAMGRRAAQRIRQDTWHDTARHYLDLLELGHTISQPPIRSAA